MITLTVRKLVKLYDKKKVVDLVDLDIESAHIVGLLGPNGAGKTTTFYMVMGLIKPDEGHVFLDEEDITEFPMHIRARKGISYLPQEPSIFRRLTVKQNILAILEFLPYSKSEREDRADMLLNELGIKHLAHRTASVLSGGEKRRLEISRALATKPSFILLDEPFAGIDPLAIKDIKNIIIQLKNKGIGVLISDHNVRETLEVCDKAYILNEGKVIEYGSPEKIASSSIARRIYLGDEFRL